MRPLILRRARAGQTSDEGAVEQADLSVAQRAARARKAQLEAGQGAGQGGGQGGGQGQKPAPKRDPAPSRVAYKMHRLWLTPLFRLGLRIGVPLAITFVTAYSYLGDPVRQGVITASIMEFSRSLKTRPEFMVKLVAIEGASADVSQLIRDAFPLTLPKSSFDLDLEVLQAEIAELDMIESAALRIRPGGVLEISVKQRQPEVIWRSRAGLVLLDHKGNQIDTIARREQRRDLPLLAGAGAQDAVEEALALMRAARPLAGRLRGLVRVGQRRWDVVLSGNVTIRLPEDNPIPALSQVIALDQAQELLARAVLVVDMRNPLRPTIRMAPEATAQMRRIKAIELGDPT